MFSQLGRISAASRFIFDQIPPSRQGPGEGEGGSLNLTRHGPGFSGISACDRVNC